MRATPASLCAPSGSGERAVPALSRAEATSTPSAASARRRRVYQRGGRAVPARIRIRSSPGNFPAACASAAGASGEPWNASIEAASAASRATPANQSAGAAAPKTQTRTGAKVEFSTSRFSAAPVRVDLLLGVAGRHGEIARRHAGHRDALELDDLGRVAGVVVVRDAHRELVGWQLVDRLVEHAGRHLLAERLHLLERFAHGRVVGARDAGRGNVGEAGVLAMAAADVGAVDLARVARDAVARAGRRNAHLE